MTEDRAEVPRTKIAKVKSNLDKARHQKTLLNITAL